MNEPPKVRKAFKGKGDELWYAVERHDGETALVRRHGNIQEFLTCERCGVTLDTSFKCQDVEAVAKSQYMSYEE